jgi:hypothetical protein
MCQELSGSKVGWMNGVRLTSKWKTASQSEGSFEIKLLPLLFVFGFLLPSRRQMSTKN